MRKRDFIISVAIPLLVGVFAALLTGDGMMDYGVMTKPPLSPPGWLFPVVWTVLYTLMGVSAYLVTISGKENVNKALAIYGIQLLVNFFWSILFFGFEWYFVAFLWLILLWALIFLMIREFLPISKGAACLQIPYLLWVTFAGYLNLAIAVLN